VFENRQGGYKVMNISNLIYLRHRENMINEDHYI
jgi:hypothetical protein